MREFLLSLGIILGIMAPQADPVLAARLFRADNQLYSTVEVRNALGPDALKLLRAGNRLELAVTVTGPLEGETRSFSHSLEYEPIAQRYAVGIAETGQRHVTTNETAALDIFGRFFALALIPVSDLTLPATLRFDASLANLSDPGFDTAVLWNYKKPTLEVAFNSLSDWVPPPSAAVTAGGRP